MEIYHSQTPKPIDRFVDDLDQAARARGFVIQTRRRWRWRTLSAATARMSQKTSICT